ncbi:c-type cytochrome [Allorhodopirellula solitaria]|uniref:Cytochrome c4 n=1 Tax=Allorhodopirellula solitaria TaxID=2527987 RepID=A0A5C5XYB7_9BACT|nr:c-type cytochrome [Allorhodopirellula solitaria]TWT66512.1 Cytochrome c4 precursor [Allorhodopirellula solitaria]
MKRRLKELAILLTGLGILGVIVLVSGIVPIKASSGHWPITRWILDFASNRSVGLHSSRIEVPPLDEPGMIRLGAATFDSNCRWCHGAPGFSQPPVAAQMTPHPPELSEAAGSWDDAELFYIIQHGIKFAGMPAWPTQKRNEEIWPVVAFLRALPHLDAGQYLDFTQGDGVGIHAAETPIDRQVQSLCAACHGTTGSKPTNDRVPVLASQSRVYLKRSLQSFRDGNRYSGVMMPIAHRLTSQQIDKMASYFAEQPRDTSPPTDSRDEGLIERGRVLAHHGDQAAKIPSCIDCHGPGENAPSDEYPRLAGQPARYLQRQLELIAQGNRGGSDNASIMHPIANKLDKSERRALAAFYASISGSDTE